VVTGASGGRAAPANREAYRAWLRITLRWADNDVYGHVNNTVYYQWFDSAVNGWLVGQGLLDIAGGDPIALVVETRCTFHAPLSFPGEVDIGLAVAQLGRSSVRYSIGVFSPGADVAAAQGEFVHVAVGRSDRRPVAWPAEWRSALQTLCPQPGAQAPE
jgi:acyl-CoA thioester hydrolase